MRARLPAVPLPTRSQVQLLRAAVLPGPRARESWAEWRAAGGDPEQLDKASARLLPQLYRNLHAVEPNDPDMPVLKRAHRQGWSSNQMKVDRGVGVLRALEQAGIQTLVLKGVAVGLLHYDSLGARPMDDLDVAVPGADAVRAVGIVEREGFRPLESRARDLILLVPAQAFFDPEGFGVDLHATILWQPEADELFWSAAVPLRVNDVETRALCATDQVIHACLHGSRWHGVAPIRWIVDAMKVLQAPRSEVDWHRVEVVAARARVGLRLAAMLEYLRTEFEAPVPAEVVTALRAAPLSAVERHAHRTISRQPSTRRTVGMLTLWWIRYKALARLRSERPGAAGFLSYLQRFWGLRSRWRLLWRGSSWLLRTLRNRRSASRATPSG